MAFDWGSLAGAAVSLYGANQGAKAAKSAGKAAAAGSEAGNKVIWDMFQQSRQDQMPAIQAGNVARNEYMQMLGLAPVSMQQQSTMDPAQAYLAANPDVAATRFAQNPYEHYQLYGQREGRQWGAPAQAQQGTGYNAQQITDKLRSTPGYGFAFGEGQRALDSSAAARGGLFSGAAAKALAKYGQGVADQSYGSYMDRLASLSGMAQTATGRVGDWGQSAATNVASGLQSAGRARASGIAGAGQAWNQGLGDAWSYTNQAARNSGWW